MDLLCRLCSSKKCLISMFSGKYRKERDYIRKLIAITTGLHIEPKDYLPKCVCINCCIRAFNFYKFQCLSRQNERNIINNTKGKEKDLKNNKSDVVSNIILPPNELLFKYVKEWLHSKLNVCIDEQKDTKKPVKIKSNDKSVQTILVNNCRVNSTQTEVVKLKCVDRSVQVSAECAEKSAQSSVKNKDSSIQTLLIAAKKVNSSTQTMLPNNMSPLLMPANNLLTICTDNNELARFNKILSPNSATLMSVKNRSTPVEICPICDKSVYKKKDLKSHLKMHKQCHLCKRKFRTLQATKKHVERDCKILLCSKDVPKVYLTKIESIVEIKKKYPQAIKQLQTLMGGVNKFRIRSKSLDSNPKINGKFTGKFFVTVADKSSQTNMYYDLLQDNFLSKLSLKRELLCDVEVSSKKMKNSPTDISDIQHVLV